jgi:hypothetical protein
MTTNTKYNLTVALLGAIFLAYCICDGYYKTTWFSKKVYLIGYIAGRDDSKYNNPLLFYKFKDLNSNSYCLPSQESPQVLDFSDTVYLHYQVHNYKFYSRIDTVYISYSKFPTR